MLVTNGSEALGFRKGVARGFATAFIGGWSTVLNACSGLHVQETIRGVDQMAAMGAAACVLLGAFGLLFRLRIATPIALASLVIHPAWTLSSVSGDCGAVKQSVTFLIAVITLGTFGWDLLRRPKKR